LFFAIVYKVYFLVMGHFLPFSQNHPEVSSSCFLAPEVWVTGKVSIQSESSVFFGSVIRGDIQAIRIGERTNVQEHCVLHTSHGLSDCVVGSDVTVGHKAILHGCEVQDRVVIGMGSIVLDGAVIEEDCIIGANTLVPMNKVIPKGSMAFGSPVKVIRKLTEDEISSILDSAKSYVEVSRQYMKLLRHKE